MYQFLVSFTVRPEHRDDFVRAAKKTVRDSLANEPGSHRFEVIADEFNTHASGPYFSQPRRRFAPGRMCR